MAQPVDIDRYCNLMVLDDDELERRGTSAAIIERLHRLRGIYNYWLQFPSKSGGEIVSFSKEMFKVSMSQAYDDLHLVQVMLGRFQQTTKEFMRWKINQDLEEDLRQAREQGDMKSVAAIEKNRILNNRTDKEDEVDLEFDKIVPQHFVPTDDPSVLGIQKIPQLRERIREMELLYRNGGVQDADYTEVDEDGTGE